MKRVWVASATAMAMTACSPQPPARRLGILAAVVDSALQLQTRVTCNTVGLSTQEGGTEWATGCYLYSKDSSLSYFYVRRTGEVLAWGRDWHVPDSSRARALRALGFVNDSRYGPGRSCPPSERLEGFTVWSPSGYFVYAFADAGATKLSLPRNIYEGARLGSPKCTFRDVVAAPFLR
jgi:hypothetical protein